MTSRIWKNFLTELPSNDDGNKNIVSFSEAMSKDLSSEERVKNMTEDKNEIVACVDGDGKIQLVHSISNLGRTRARSNKKILGIIGMDNQGICVELVESSMVSDCVLDAPSLGAYRRCQTAEYLGEIEPDGGGAFGGSPAFIMAPFLRAAVLHAGTNETLDLIPAVIHAAEKFDRENAILDEDYESAVNHAQMFSDWLWGVFKEEVGETEFLLQVKDGEVSGYSKKRHQECIMFSTNDIEGAQPSALDSVEIMQQLPAGTSRQNKVISESNFLAREEFGRKQEKDEEKKNRVSKLHSSFQNMLLIALIAWIRDRKSVVSRL